MRHFTSAFHKKDAEEALIRFYLRTLSDPTIIRRVVCREQTNSSRITSCDVFFASLITRQGSSFRSSVRFVDTKSYRKLVAEGGGEGHNRLSCLIYGF